MYVDTGYDSTGVLLPAGFSAYARVNTYNGDGSLASTTASGPGGVYVQTVTYAPPAAPVYSFWVKKAYNHLPDARALGWSTTKPEGVLQPPIVVSASAPVDADGREDGTIYIQTA